MATNSVDQLERMIQIAKDNFSPERFKKVEVLFDHFAERMLAAPASGKVHFHNAYPGGYLDHVLGVIDAVFQVTKTMKGIGAEIDFTLEEAIFSAMFHDLGKLGDLDQPYYLVQENDWYRENRGELYKRNPDLPFMHVPLRGLQLLSHFGIVVNPKEWRGIQLSDGLYSDSNKGYYMEKYQYPAPAFYTNIYHVIHFADHMATIAEKDRHRLEGN